MTYSYLEWIEQKSQEIAHLQHGLDYYDLPDDLQLEIDKEANDSYYNYYADPREAALELALETHRKAKEQVECLR
jgi:hypothetical protein